MSFTKYAQVEEILEVRSSAERLSYEYGAGTEAGLNKFAGLEEGIREKDGFLYVRARAISSRVNKNNDGWPSSELKGAYSTFLGRPVFVDHNNDDPKRTRGVIVSSQLHEEDPDKTSALDPYYSTAPDNHKPPTWIELLIEVDAETFPKLAKHVRNADIDAVSMGANIDRSVCSVCANEATTPQEYCSHIKQKGLTFEITADNGEKVTKKSYEDCYGVNFFEISFVFDPADETALISEKTGKTAAGQTQRIHQDMGKFFEYQAVQQDIARLSDAELNDAYMSISNLPADPENNIQHNVILDEMEKRGLWNGRKEFQWEGSLADSVGKKVDDSVMDYVRSRKSASLDLRDEKVQDEFLAYVASTFKKQALTPDDLMSPIGAPGEQPHDKNYIPQSDQVTAPQQVDTLREENVCPVCHASSMQTDPDGILRCPVCGHVQPPEPLDNPDLSLAQETDLRQDSTDVTNAEGDPQVNVDNGASDTRGVTFEPVMPVAAIKTNVANGVMSDMFDLKLKTSSKAEADKILPVAEGRLETTLGTDNGIHAGVYQAIAKAGLSASVTFPDLPAKDAKVNVPTDNPILPYLMSMDASHITKTKVADVRVVIEADSQAEAEKIAELIRSAEAPQPVAAKKPILPESRKPSDVPAEKIVSDQLEPVETSKKVGDTVTVDGTQYVLAPLPKNEDEEKKDADELADEVKDADEKKDDVKEDEKEKEDSSEEKESRLLHAFKIADEHVALGLLDADDKMAFIADLEKETTDALDARERTLASVKQAGITRNKTSKVAGITRVPRLSHNPVPVGTTDLIPDEAIFLN